jgi:hypothetical protein
LSLPHKIVNMVGAQFLSLTDTVHLDKYSITAKQFSSFLDTELNLYKI